MEPEHGGERMDHKNHRENLRMGANLGLDKGLCLNIQMILKENCHNPTLTSKRYLEHRLGEVRQKRKGTDKDIRKGQNKEWREKVEKWVDGNCKEAYSLMKMAERGNVHHSVGMGRIPNILEEVDNAEKCGKGGGTRKDADVCRSAWKNMKALILGSHSRSRG